MKLVEGFKIISYDLYVQNSQKEKDAEVLGGFYYR
jgi:hypothetical protein